MLDNTMSNRWVGTVVVASAGVVLLWLGLGGVFAGSDPGGLPINALGFVCGLAALVIGEWLCWRAAARHVTPPVSAEQVVNVACVVLLGVLLLAAAMLSIRVYGIS